MEKTERDNLLRAVGQVMGENRREEEEFARARILRSEARMEFDDADGLAGLVNLCLDDIGDFCRDFMAKGKRPARLPTAGKNANPLVSGSLFPERPDR